MFAVLTCASIPAFAQTNSDLPALPPEMGDGAAVDTGITLPAPIVVQETPKAETTTPTVVRTQTPEPVVAQPTTANVGTANQVQEVFPSGVANVVTVPSTPETEAAAQPTAPQIKENYIPSYGNFTQSLMFNSTDIDRMKKVLYAYESVKRIDKPTASTQTPEVPILPIAAVEEPKQYPSFYLSSIVYRSPKDWLLWMNNAKYSPKKRPGEATLLSISPRAAVFSWKPEYIEQAKLRFEQSLIDKTIPKHFKSAMSKVRYDENREAFVFTLAPNQSFVGAAFGIYEGKYASRDVPEMEQQAQVDALLAPAAPVAPNPNANRDPDAALRATVQDLDRMRSNLTQLAPRNNPNAANTPTTPSTPAPSSGASASSAPAPTASTPGASMSLPPAQLMPTTITLDAPTPAPAP
ncbi:MAG: hypothetical protein J0M34_04065 [Alphaproteobacteria bacterium]|nr:hypothetical protein [Alphaproteobacteria bacterium]